MLITCPECGHQVSDKASSCPNCGYPLLKPQQTKPIPKPQLKSKRMKLPNGFGRITKITGKNLRKPYRAMVSDGKDSNGKPIGRLLKPESYFKTYNEAYQALVRYNENPYDFGSMITMQELYDKWYAFKETTISKNTLRNYDTAWCYCDTIKDRLVQDLRIRDVKLLLDNCQRVDIKGNITTPSNNYKLKIKDTISQMLDYAVEYEIIQTNFLKNVKLSVGAKEPTNSHISFTDEEMEVLWNNSKYDLIVRQILVNCYSGFRPSELCNLKVKNVNIRDDCMVGGSKTEAGRERVVPIHSKVKAFIAEKYNEALLSGRETLFDTTYAQYEHKFSIAMKRYNLSDKHRPHDSRKQFVTMAKKAGVDEFAIKRIVGHRISDITESIYTDRSTSWLKSEIEKIK